jgi:hypothetical protein
MKNVILISLLLLLIGHASANSYFKVVEVSPIIVAPDSESNFTVTLRSMGGSGAFAEPIFSLPNGLSAKSPGGLKYIVATGSRVYNCTMLASNITPGNYTFRIGVYAQDAPYSWRTAYAIVISPLKSTNLNFNLSENANKSVQAQPDYIESNASNGNKSSPAKTPGPGIVLIIVALIIAAKRGRD